MNYNFTSLWVIFTNIHTNYNQNKMDSKYNNGENEL